MESAARSKSKRITEEGLELQKLAHQIEKFTKDQSNAVLSLREMEKEYEWIADERESFGRANSPYDFQGQNIAECKSSLRNIQERFQGMKKKINPRVMNMIDSVEKKEAALKQMMKTVIKDKRKIEETIVSLDEYKKTALNETWRKVNGDFGQIFADLLPGSFARLDPPEGKAVADGLEVRVCLGKVWKQSLAELSGGQRFVILAPPCPLIHSLPFQSSPPLSTNFSTQATLHVVRLTNAKPQIPNSPLPHPRPPPIQARAHVHPRRSGRRPRSISHAEHRAPDQDALPGLAVHRRLAQGRHVPERESGLQDALRGGDQRGAGYGSGGVEVIGS